jgi:hypothetical protein
MCASSDNYTAVCTECAAVSLCLRRKGNSGSSNKSMNYEYSLDAEEVKRDCTVGGFREACLCA